jgi:hypothetical protein
MRFGVLSHLVIGAFTEEGCILHTEAIEPCTRAIATRGETARPGYFEKNHDVRMLFVKNLKAIRLEFGAQCRVSLNLDHISQGFPEVSA